MNKTLKNLLKDVIKIEINGIKSISDSLEKTLGAELLNLSLIHI